MDNFNHNESQPFYNTVEYKPAEWEIANNKAIAMQKLIRGIYEANPGVEITPYMIYDYLVPRLTYKVNLNSVRRSISNLKNEEVIDLIKGKTKIGREGVPEHYYVLRGTGPAPEHIYKKGSESAGDIAKMLINSNLK
jgi:hypothetical protein